MKKYRKKPIVIEAVQWDGSYDSGAKILEDMNTSCSLHPCRCGNYEMTINTLEGNMFASKGDYIIRGIKGEIYPCKPDIFEASYEAVNET